MAKKTLGLSRVGNVVAAIILSFLLAACGSVSGQSSQSSSDEQSQSLEQESSPEAPKPPTDVSGGSPWVDSNLKDNIKPNMQTSPKDDLYLYANYDWLLETDIPEGSRVAGENLAAGGREHAAKAVSGDDLADHDARQTRGSSCGRTDTLWLRYWRY